MQRVKNIHLIGIGGSGMSGIAEVLITQGYNVSGSDIAKSSATERLAKLGATIFSEHHENNLQKADIVISSSAIDKNNPELLAALKKRIPILKRAQMLGELMRFHYGIAISGTHGKTTTTSLIASILGEAGFDPTFVIGGVLNACGANARLGASNYFVAEADESDSSFLHLHPRIAVVTNIDDDHMETYKNDFSLLRKAFLDFLQNLPFYGVAVVCIENATINAMLGEIGRHTITYGFSDNADVWAGDLKSHGMSCEFTVHIKNKKVLNVNLNLVGKHNILNALAAIAVAIECGVNDSLILNALAHFRGVGRRLQNHGEISFPYGRAILIDDYAHHPSEINASMEAMREAWPNNRFVLVFQPHRYSRMRDLLDDFARVLSDILSMNDVLILLDVYSAGEEKIADIDSKALARNIRKRGKLDPILASTPENLPQVLSPIIKENDILLLQGAGSIGSAVALIKNYFK